MTPADRTRRIARLMQVAAIRRDADLAALAAVSARLVAAERTRAELAAALAKETRRATDLPDLQTFRALDVHLLFAERGRALLEGRIAAIGQEHEAVRTAAATSFGRAVALEGLQKAAAARQPTEAADISPPCPHGR